MAHIIIIIIIIIIILFFVWFLLFIYLFIIIIIKYICIVQGFIMLQNPVETRMCNICEMCWQELKDSETVVSQEMVRHGSVDQASLDAAAVETGSMDEAAEERDGWLTAWKLPVLSDVVSKTSSVVQQTVQQTSNVVRVFSR